MSIHLFLHISKHPTSNHKHLVTQKTDTYKELAEPRYSSTPSGWGNFCHILMTTIFLMGGLASAITFANVHCEKRRPLI